MPLSYKVPGVYPTLEDKSTIVKGDSTSTAAIVGAAEFGPIDKRVLISDSRNYMDLFGKPNAKYSYMGYCALNYLEEGSELYVTRVVGSGALMSSIKVNKVGASGATQASGGLSKTAILSNLFTSDTDAAFLLRAENPGDWGDKIKVEVTNVDNTENTFTINVYQVIEGLDVLKESFPGLSRNPSAVDGYNKTIYHVNVLEKSSLFIRSHDNTTVSGLPQAVTPTLITGGDDGSLPTESDVAEGWDLYSNPDDIDIDLLLNGGYVTSTTFGVQTKMKAIAESRRDCRALLDAPLSELAMSPSSDLSDWRKTVQNFNTYFTSLDAPWIRIRDNINGGIELDIPTSGFTAQIMARKDKVREPWNAAAGTQLTGNIGIISSSYFSILGLTINYTQTQQGVLYADNNINVYRNKPGIGVVRWGQKTQQVKASALDRENVVTLSIIIENNAKRYLDSAVFELNTKTVRSDISETLQLFMGNIQARGGLYAFSVICDETNNTSVVIDNNELVVDIIYQPVKAAEFIRLRGTITKTGASLAIAQY